MNEEESREAFETHVNGTLGLTTIRWPKDSLESIADRYVVESLDLHRKTWDAALAFAGEQQEADRKELEELREIVGDATKIESDRGLPGSFEATEFQGKWEINGQFGNYWRHLSGEDDETCEFDSFLEAYRALRKAQEPK